MVDYKKIRESPETERQKISEQLHTSLNDEKFKSRLFLTIFRRAVDGIDSTSSDERYLSNEILMMVFDEVMKDSEMKFRVVKE